MKEHDKEYADLIYWLQTDPYRFSILEAIQKYKKLDLWVAGGFVRNLVWDKLHNYQFRTELGDIDVFYYDIQNVSKDQDMQIQSFLEDLIPNIEWSVKNQARMHLHNKEPRYHSLIESLYHFPEIESAVAVKIDFNNQIRVLAPYGLKNLFNLTITPASSYLNNPKRLLRFKERYSEKQWLQRWPKLKLNLPNRSS